MDKKTARQQVRRHGIDKANEADLLALIGVPMESVPWNNVNNVCELRRNYGWTEARAATLLAAIELGRRAAQLEADEMKILRSSPEVAALMFPMLMGRSTESFFVIGMDTRGAVKGIREISRGGSDECVVDIRQILRVFLDLSASSGIVVHNHPSGKSDPSPHDKMITMRIAEACRIIGFKLLDHVILGDGNWYSFRDEGQM